MRAALCEHFKWTLEYLTWGVEWAVVQRLMMDAPSYDFDKDNENLDGDIVLNEDNAQEVTDYINGLIKK